MTGVFIYSCSNEFGVDPTSPVQEQGGAESMVKLGKKLEYPYSVENMQIALDAILKEVSKSNTQYSRVFRINYRGYKNYSYRFICSFFTWGFFRVRDSK